MLIKQTLKDVEMRWGDNAGTDRIYDVFQDPCRDAGIDKDCKHLNEDIFFKRRSEYYS